MSKRPLFRITFARKDGEDIEFTNYKGQTVEKKYAPLGAMFARDKGTGFSLAIDPSAENHKLDPESFWYNVYPVDDDDDKPRGKPARKPPGKPARKSKAADDDDDLEY